MKHFSSLITLALILMLVPLMLMVVTAAPRSVYAAAWTVDTLADGWGNCNVAGQCTLRTAISWAISGDTIGFDPSLNGTIAITMPNGFWIDKNVTIDGDNRITVNAGTTTDSAFIFATGSNGALLKNITIEGNATSSGLVYVGASGITLQNITVRGNGKGAGIKFEPPIGGTVSSGAVISSTVENNSSDGILISNATGITVQNSLVRANGGAGIAVSGSSLITSSVVITASTIVSNNPGVNLWGASGNIIQNNYIGIYPSNVISGNVMGISIANGSSNNQVIGNHIAYNKYQNILLAGSGTSGNILRDNHIYSGACQTPPVEDNAGISITSSATHNVIGPNNTVECHRYSGIQVMDQGTNNNQIITNTIQLNGTGVLVINSVNTPTEAFPATGPTTPGPMSTTILGNKVMTNTYQGIYVARSLTVTIGATGRGNTIQGNGGPGVLIVGSSGTLHGNQIKSNGGGGVRIEPHYGSDRNPANDSDDVVSNFDISGNTFASNTGAGIYGLDNEADYDQDPVAVHTNNTFSGTSSRIVQQWLGAVEVLDTANQPVTTIITGSVISSACGNTYFLEQYNNGAWGPSNNGLGNGTFSLSNVGTWFLLLSDFVDKDGTYITCEPHRVSATTTTLRGEAWFSFDGNASTHPVTNDVGIPSSRPSGVNRNGRYQVAQINLKYPTYLPLVVK